MISPRFLTLLVILILLMAACSQAPQDIRPPVLEPQFGTSGEDSVTQITFNRQGYLYAVGDWGREAYLRRYDRSGSLLWEKYPEAEAPYNTWENQSFYIRSVVVDTYGNAFIAWTGYYSNYDEYTDMRQEESRHYLSKYDRNGAQKFRVSARPFNDLAIDSSGNVYAIAGEQGYLTKYTATGNRAWERYDFAEPQDLTVSSAGNIYLAREDGYVVKYSSSNVRLWAKKLLPGSQDFTSDCDEWGCYESRSVSYRIAAGLNDELYVSGGPFVHTHDGDSCSGTSGSLTLRRFDRNGGQLWAKPVEYLSEGGCFEYYDGTVEFEIATDSSGNAYLVSGLKNGAWCGDNSCTNAFATKYTRAGSMAWMKNFGTSEFDAATTIATYDGSEIFVGGVTHGYLVHKPFGEGDAFLREMNSSGARVWTR